MKLTISDVARLANVSVSTVSIVINQKSGVSNKTREKVLKIIKKYNYNPNQNAQSLASKETKSIGLIIREIDNPYYSKVIKGVYDSANKNGYSVLLGSAEFERENDIINTMISKRVDGLIISPMQNYESDFFSLANLTNISFPFVVLGMPDNQSLSSVDIDNNAAAFEAVSHLIELGHTRIAYFGGPEHSEHSVKRLAGYQKALNENGIPLSEQQIFSMKPIIEDSFNIATKVFTSKEQNPTAILCYNDATAFGVVFALEKLGIKIPDEVSLIGFDNTDFGKYIKPPLSTIEIPALTIGEKAFELLMKAMHSEDELTNEKVILDYKFVRRNTCMGVKKHTNIV